jgi:hypothetical protein
MFFDGYTANELIVGLVVIASIITGELDSVPVTLNALLEMFGWLYIPADIAYNMLKDQR